MTDTTSRKARPVPPTLRPCPRCGHPRPTGGACPAPDCDWMPWDQRPRGNTTARGLGGNHQAIRRQVLDEESLCVYCTEPVNKTLPGTHRRGPVAAHVIARAHGGANERDNYRLAHKDCNEKAGTS